MTNKTLVLVDGSSYFYRAFHALPPLNNSKGQPTGAVYGVLNMIRRLLKDYDPDYVGIVFDAKGKTFRDDMYPEYKATREAMPNDLVSQIEPLFEIVTALGLPMLVVEGVEADDVIGTLARQATKEGIDTIVSTGDKDMAQLVDDNVTLINTMSNTKMDIPGVIEKFGIGPELIIDYLTLIGDKSDNIPGVNKVGPKTAVKWLTEYGNLDNIIENADQIKGKVGEHLRNSLSYLPLSRKLVTIKDDVPLDKMPSELIEAAPDKEKLIELYQNLEFKNWLNELLTEKTPEKPEKKYHTILSEADFQAWVKRLKDAEVFAFDTETTSLNALRAELVGLSFSLVPEEAVYIPVAHDYENAPEQLDIKHVLETLKPIFADEKIKKIAQNAKYDLTVLNNYDIEVHGVIFDTMLESYVLNSAATRHDMDSLSLKYLGKNTIHFEDIAGKGAKQKTFNQIELEEAAPYAAEDADITLQLHQKLLPKIEKLEGIKYIFNEIEMPLVKVLARIEQNGVRVDTEKLAEQSEELAVRIEEIKQQVHTEAGMEFNLGSPKQLQEVLFEKLNLPVVQKTPTGQPSTAESVLQELAHEYVLPKLILEYRSLAKLKSTYTDALPKQINPNTGRVHTSYNQAVTATGRLSSTEPNLQNIPIRTEQGRRIRYAFTAAEGNKIVSADYSQIELRIMAHLSGDDGLCDAFKKGLDVHRATAAEVFNVELDAVTDEQRRSAKAINFGLIYGMSAFGLANQLEISRQDAQAYVEMYFQRYPKVKLYIESIKACAHAKGYVETLFGRRLYLPEINAQNFMRKRAAERAAINAPMQGTAADIIKLAMIHVDEFLQQSSLDVKMIMQVHDELVFEVAESQVNSLIEAIKDKMQNAATLDVPLIVDVGQGDNWGDAH